MTRATVQSSGDREEVLAAEMAAAWRRGERLPAETWLERHPELLSQPEAAVRLVYEEICLRQECGEEVRTDEVLQRFPRWSEELALVFDCHQLLRSRKIPAHFPAVGEVLGDFRLIAELGRGSEGRVFLATQSGLADRPVVLKVTARRAREHLSLARLQHTHIIPLHALYDFPDRNLRALCLPYLGGATLAQVLETMHEVPPCQRTGPSLGEALESAARKAPVRLPGRGGFRQTLTRLTYVEAICHIGACLADALHYAHERGLVHLDLKPANVLLAADGQPLLLDFHLALQPLEAGRLAPEGLGGTPGFMAPEHERACAAARVGRPVSEAVDARADIYALGRLLEVALGGEDTVAEGRQRPLNRRNPQVSVGLADIVRKCLATHPEDRYAAAAAVAADLRRHLAGLPLQGVPNRSIRERWHKWRRRSPSAPLWLGLLLALTAAAAALAASSLERLHDARNALSDGETELRRGAPAEAVRTLARGKARVQNWPGSRALEEVLDTRLREARSAQAIETIHALAEQARFVSCADALTAENKRNLERQCRAAWELRGLAAEEAGEELRADLLDLALLGVDLQRQGEQLPEASRAEGLRRLAEIEALCGSDTTLMRERQALAGEPLPEATSAPKTFREQMALGRSLLRAGDLNEAAKVLEKAGDACPQDFWANFLNGVCAYRRSRFADAVHFFGIAIALSPASAEAYYNRAMAQTALGRPTLAVRDYDRALARGPQMASAVLNRGIIHYQEGRYQEARADLERALDLGADPASVHYNLALVHVACRDREAARTSVQRALSHAPLHREALALREQLR